MRHGLRATWAIARVTVAEAVRSRVVLGVSVGLALALLGLAVQASGDGTEAGRARSFLAASSDVSWALLAVVAIFLSTQSLARELEDGRAVPVALTPVPRGLVLLGKWLGLGVVLGGLLAAASGAGAVRVLVGARLAQSADREQIEREVLVGREASAPPRLLTHPGFLLDPPRPGQSAALRALAMRALTKAQARLDEMVKDGRLPPGVKPQEALVRLAQDEVVKVLCVQSGKETEWIVGPIAPSSGGSVSLRYRYRALGDLPPGRGPKGVFTIEAYGLETLEKAVSSAPDAYHELPVPDEVLGTPTVRSLVDGTVSAVRETERAGRSLTLVEIEGQAYEVPRTWKLLVAAGKPVKAGDALATSDRVFVRIAYRNEDAPGIVVVFPPEGIEVLHKERGFGTNELAAFGVLFGRLLFVLAIGLALSTFLDGKVAALATLFLLLVAAGHGFLDDAVGPILAGPQDNVFGPLDAPVKALLRGVLWALPDLGRDDPSEALATGRSVLGVATSLGFLGGAVALGSLGFGSWVLARREIGGGR